MKINIDRAEVQDMQRHIDKIDEYFMCRAADIEKGIDRPILYGAALVNKYPKEVVDAYRAHIEAAREAKEANAMYRRGVSYDSSTKRLHYTDRELMDLHEGLI